MLFLVAAIEGDLAKDYQGSQIQHISGGLGLRKEAEIKAISKGSGTGGTITILW